MADAGVVHACRAATPPASAGGESVAGSVTLTRATVTWQPDDPAAAAARELDVRQITGAPRQRARAC
jgi:hypothetical protein